MIEYTVPPARPAWQLLLATPYMWLLRHVLGSLLWRARSLGCQSLAVWLGNTRARLLLRYYVWEDGGLPFPWSRR
jgi:hypothetical protein